MIILIKLVCFKIILSTTPWDDDFWNIFLESFWENLQLNYFLKLLIDLFGPLFGNPKEYSTSTELFIHEHGRMEKHRIASSCKIFNILFLVARGQTFWASQ